MTTPYALNEKLTSLSTAERTKLQLLARRQVRRNTVDGRCKYIHLHVPVERLFIEHSSADSRHTGHNDLETLLLFLHELVTTLGDEQSPIVERVLEFPGTGMGRKLVRVLSHTPELPAYFQRDLEGNVETHDSGPTRLRLVHTEMSVVVDAPPSEGTLRAELRWLAAALEDVQRQLVPHNRERVKRDLNRAKNHFFAAVDQALSGLSTEDQASLRDNWPAVVKELGQHLL